MDPVGAGLQPHEPLGRPKGAEWTTPKAHNGFDPARSRLVQSGTGSDYELYENEDGSFTRRIHLQPVNYRAADGRWTPIDTRLVRSPEGRWQAAANSTEVSFAAASATQSWGGGPVTDPEVESTASGDLAKVVLPGGQLLALQLSNARLAAPSVDGSAATYAEALPATDLTLVANRAGIDATLVLKDRTAPSSWVFPLRLQGLTHKTLPDGSISLMDKAGVALTIRRQTSQAVRYEMVVEAGRAALRVTADRAWLDDKARVYPVQVDVSVRSDVSEDDIQVEAGGARSILKFDSFGRASHAASDKTAGLNVIKATLNLSHVWSARCGAGQKVYAYGTGASPIGELSIDHNYPACQNRSGERWVSRQWKLPITDLSVLRNGDIDKGIALAAETQSRFVEPSLEMTLASNTPPQIDAQYPAHGYTTPTLTPELLVLARDPDNGPAVTTYRFFVYEVNETTTTPVVDSGGFSAATAWTVPAGPLQRGRNYVWTVQAWDGMDAATSNTWNTLSTQTVQQPITSALSQNDGKGIAPNIGNYTTSAVDAQVPTPGPALAIERFYNSRDPRTEHTFGAGWSSILDAKITNPVDDRVVVTYPNGQDVTFGRNPADGTYFAPPGRHATLTGVTGAFALVDKDGTQYVFALASGNKLLSVTDSAGRTLRRAMLETCGWVLGGVPSRVVQVGIKHRPARQRGSGGYAHAQASHRIRGGASAPGSERVVDRRDRA